MTSRWIWLCALLTMGAGCADRPPQHAAADAPRAACPTTTMPAYSSVGSITRTPSTGMLLQLKTRC